MMSYYMVISSNSSAVQDQSAAALYIKLADQSVINHGGSVLVSTGNIELFEGQYNYPRFKIYQFPDRETALIWNRSEEFGHAVSQRPLGFEVNRIMVPEYSS
jgi:uncharacterized protein (DUF1330 family)